MNYITQEPDLIMSTSLYPICLDRMANQGDDRNEVDVVNPKPLGITHSYFLSKYTIV